MKTNEKKSNIETFTAENNNNYIINNNLAQYSVYLIKNSSSDDFKIEGFVQFNFKHIKNYSNIHDFRCLVKIKHNEELLELIPIDSPIFNNEFSKKLICEFQPTDFQNLNLKNIEIAIIRAADYNKTLDIDFFNTSMFTQPVVLPYLLINFQRPTIITHLEPLLPSVGFCTHYTYGIPPQLFNWIDLHLSFGIAEIMFYDATDDNELTRVINEKYGNEKRLILRSINVNRDSVCDEAKILNKCKFLKCSLKVIEFLNTSCNQFYDNEFIEKLSWRRKFEQISSNDCFTQFSKKYEFVSYYDLDEIVFPRSLDSIGDFFEAKNFYNCNDTKKICQKTHPMQFKPNNTTENSNYYYNYLIFLIEKYKNGQDVEKIESLRFYHSLYIMPNYMEVQIIQSIGSIINRIDESTVNGVYNYLIFPLKFYLRPENSSNGQIFEIFFEDVDYIKYLYKAYNQLIPCIYRSYIEPISSLDQTMLRYMYITTPAKQRGPKCIYKSKNVRSLFIHYAKDTKPGSWTLDPSQESGHILAHYRKDISKAFGKHNFTVSIRKLNIDFEYIFYLLKNHTRFCQ